jgi:hypothetical protein
MDLFELRKINLIYGKWKAISDIEEVARGLMKRQQLQRQRI